MKPMKAFSKTPDLNDLRYPLYALPKLDGIRCIIKDGQALTNTLKLIPNLSVQAWAKANAEALEGLDGELMCDGDFNDVQSMIMTIKGASDWWFCAFDLWDMPLTPFRIRYDRLRKVVFNYAEPDLEVVPCNEVYNAEELQEIWDSHVDDGLEGTIARDPEAFYKFGRSTLNEQGMIKLKNWEDDEAIILATKALQINTNEIELNGLGLAKRGHSQDGMVDIESLGAFYVTWKGRKFWLGGGTGFNDKSRVELWNKREELVGQKATFKYFGVSAYGVPRHPNFKGVRYE